MPDEHEHHDDVFMYKANGTPDCMIKPFDFHSLRVTVVDSNGIPVGRFTGTVDVSDSVGRLVTSSGGVAAELTGVAITNGVGTFQVQADSNVGELQRGSVN